MKWPVAVGLGLLASLLVSGGQPLPAAVPGALTIPVKGNARLRMTTGRSLVSVLNPGGNALLISTFPGDPTAILITGRRHGVVRVVLVDDRGTRETCEVTIRADKAPATTGPRQQVQKPTHLPGQVARTPDDFELFLEKILDAPRGPGKVFRGSQCYPAIGICPKACAVPKPGKPRVPPKGKDSSEGRPGGMSRPGNRGT